MTTIETVKLSNCQNCQNHIQEDNRKNLLEYAVDFNELILTAETWELLAAQRHELLILACRFDHAAPLAARLVADAAWSVTWIPIPRERTPHFG